jgi:hypothetical protein
MKRITIILTIVLIASFAVSAQNEEDALRYSRQYITGTARAASMAGAMGAIGGDFTSLSINPAGLGIYRKGEFTFSPSLNWNTTQSDFLGNKIDQTRYGMKIANIGFVFAKASDDNSGLAPLNVAFGYNQLNNFNQNILMTGISTSGSLLDNFTDIYNKSSVTPSEYYEVLAHDVDLIAWDSAANEYFNDFHRGGYGQEQQRTVNSSGSIGEYLFSLGTNYSHKIYFGATFGLQKVKYEKSIEHTETDQGNRAVYTEKFVFNEDLLTRGYGVNLKLGVIARPVDFIRLGLAYHVPTLYFLNDRFSTGIHAWYDQNLNLASASSESRLGEYDYRIKTPSKIIGSAAVTISKFGLLSIDYERINFTNASLEGSDYGFIAENKAIEQNFKSANNLRMGAELRLGSGYLRGGYAIYGTPFKVVDPKAESKYAVMSAGAGLRKDDFFFDICYASGVSTEAYYMYLPQMTTGSINKSNLSNVIMTFGLKF